MSLLDFLATRWEDILAVSWWHLRLSLMAVALALGIGLPLGILSHMSRLAAAVVLNAVSVIYTVPTLALFGLMIPLLGIGILPAIVAVVLYSLLPVVQNTYTGLSTIDPNLREVAIGIGMGRFTRLFRVELPLALPVIFAGLRVAVVNAIGMVTLASLIAAGGLGDFIFRGISIMSWNLVLAGSVPVLVMALGADYLLKLTEQRLSRARQGIAP
ncbi:ABC transporter permease [Ancylobacter lacus]|uniref:ABC transporter permease n=1 Tax=Ancylobacter lacus TaxID=2579970 RepID=UPI001BCF5B36|nr:ABC transporter permease [Ancylobacter lacus]MBS7537505.1 ABC transporter permease [Ancylobacter lacus]